MPFMIEHGQQVCELTLGRMTCPGRNSMAATFVPITRVSSTRWANTSAATMPRSAESSRAVLDRDRRISGGSSTTRGWPLGR